ncbi:Uncharacterised protein [[Eubacterium] infirmum]|nr:Uncharacterised protein [[Eubacterium] infirmum]STO00552.1 Uncharacterised protein [[Eubacterium] infirmum]STO01890.1 Uncharacterised protein [[Eubacterium] infirmum]
MNDINLTEILGVLTKYVLPILGIFFLLITVTIIIRIISCDSNKGSHSSNHQEEKMEDNDIYLYVAVGIVICWIIFK